MNKEEMIRRLDQQHKPATNCLCYWKPNNKDRLVKVVPDYCPIHGLTARRGQFQK